VLELVLQENPSDGDEDHRHFHGQAQDSTNGCKVVVSESNVASYARHEVVEVHDDVVSARPFGEEGHHDHICKEIA